MKRVMVQPEKCLGCHTCENVCAGYHSAAGSFLGAVLAGEKPHSGVRVLVNSRGEKLPLRCRHCTTPDCVEACPAGAMQKDPDTGAVWCDRNACVGCFLCADACPIGAITPLGKEGYPFKCDLCRGRTGGPACVEACPTGALTFEEVDESVFEKQKQSVLEFLKGVK
jgi:carbon-monoxide dehydrogenase iron sulfur subunit